MAGAGVGQVKAMLWALAWVFVVAILGFYTDHFPAWGR